VFADSDDDHPNVSIDSVRNLISKKTKAIVPVHYGGAVCKMEAILDIANEVNAVVIVDAAQALGSMYKGRPAGTFGKYSAFSFHETKNISCGEGGLLVVNDETQVSRAAVIRDKGTNRRDFRSGKVDKYTWEDIGSSYTAGELAAAFLAGQLENFTAVTARRVQIWNRYEKNLQLAGVGEKWKLASIPEHSTNNGHMFWLVTNTVEERIKFIQWMEQEGVQTLFHYQPLHQSPYGSKFAAGVLPNAERYGERLVRLPLYYELSNEGVDFVCDCVSRFLKTQV
jgi:dTDP-4-amino-4,6-dideoxygalactose transaminase